MAGRRRWFDWHSLLGQTTGMMLFVICWSGTVAVFSYEIDWLLDARLRASEATTPLAWQGVVAAAQAAYPEAEVQWVEAPRHAGFAAQVVAEVAADTSHRIYVDPVSLEVLGDTSYLNVQRFFRSFHMALFQADYFDLVGVPVGYMVVLLFAFPLLGLLVTPLVFYRRWWRGFTKLDTRKGRRVLWSDLHKLAGVWSLPFIAVIVVTSLWYLAEWYLPASEFAADEGAATAAEQVPLSEAVDRARAALPTLDVRGIYLPTAPSSVVLLQGDDGGLLTRGRARVEVDLAGGRVVGTRPTSSLGVVARLKETVDVLHFGTWGDSWSKALYVLFGLATSSLALSGTYLFARRRARRGAAGRIESVGALLVTGAALGLAGVAGRDEILGYGIEGAAPVVAPGATAFIVAWMLLTFLALAAMAVMIVRPADTRLPSGRDRSDRPSSTRSRPYEPSPMTIDAATMARPAIRASAGSRARS